MARKVIGSTNVNVGSLNDIFDYNGYGNIGGQRYPRVSSNISANNHFQNRTFYKFDAIRGANLGDKGTVSVNSPIALGPLGSITMNSYVFDETVHTGMTIEAFPAVGNGFDLWQGRVTSTGTTNLITTLNPYTFSFSTLYQYNYIEAVFSGNVVNTCTNLSSHSILENNFSNVTGTIGRGGVTYDSITVQFSTNGGTYSNAAEKTLSGTADNYTLEGCGFFYLNGDTVIARARGNCTNGASSDWYYSNTITISECQISQN